MGMQEYLATLEKALAGKIDPDQLRETMNYYQDYFYMEQSKGIAEQDIIANLGDPRLLAKSIIAAQSSENRRDEVYADAYGEKIGGSGMRKVTIPFPIIILIIILLFFGLISLVFSIASALLPILLPILIVCGIISFFKKH